MTGQLVIAIKLINGLTLYSPVVTEANWESCVRYVFMSQDLKIEWSFMAFSSK
eukprot:m.311649 g.311649  ORF g.311649 m.311649 type:complete len:53 (+) comp95374_c0_seq1:69-227(+)